MLGGIGPHIRWPAVHHRIHCRSGCDADWKIIPMNARHPPLCCQRKRHFQRNEMIISDQSILVFMKRTPKTMTQWPLWLYALNVNKFKCSSASILNLQARMARNIATTTWIYLANFNNSLGFLSSRQNVGFFKDNHVECGEQCWSSSTPSLKPANDMFVYGKTEATAKRKTNYDNNQQLISISFCPPSNGRVFWIFFKFSINKKCSFLWTHNFFRE